MKKVDTILGEPTSPFYDVCVDHFPSMLMQKKKEKIVVAATTWPFKLADQGMPKKSYS